MKWIIDKSRLPSFIRVNTSGEPAACDLRKMWTEIVNSDFWQPDLSILMDNRESAKVIANIAYRYPKKLDNAIGNLLTNSEAASAVVRWSAALALGEIVKLRTKHNKALIPAIGAIIRRENDNAIKKIYKSAVTAVGK